MTAAARYDAQQASGRLLHGAARRAALAPEPSYSIAVDPGIPVRRYGTVPPLDDEPAWMVEPLATADAPRSIADFGGTAVFVAATVAAAIAGWVLYLL